MNYKDIKKVNIYENFKGSEKLNEGILLKNVYNKKRY